MREIKFKVKADKEGDWLYGYPIKCEEGIAFFVEGKYEDGAILIEEDTLCQYTGIKDKKGKDVYEGDIIKTFHFNSGKRNYYLYHTVTWSDIYNGWFTKHAGKLETKDNEKDGGIQLFVYLRSIYGRYSNNCFEVIGNIYDNKELINK